MAIGNTTSLGETFTWEYSYENNASSGEGQEHVFFAWDEYNWNLIDGGYLDKDGELLKTTQGYTVTSAFTRNDGALVATIQENKCSVPMILHPDTTEYHGLSSKAITEMIYDILMLWSSSILNKLGITTSSYISPLLSQKNNSK